MQMLLTCGLRVPSLFHSPLSSMFILFIHGFILSMHVHKECLVFIFVFYTNSTPYIFFFNLLFPFTKIFQVCLELHISGKQVMASHTQVMLMSGLLVRSGAWGHAHPQLC